MNNKTAATARITAATVKCTGGGSDARDGRREAHKQRRRAGNIECASKQNKNKPTRKTALRKSASRSPVTPKVKQDLKAATQAAMRSTNTGSNSAKWRRNDKRQQKQRRNDSRKNEKKPPTPKRQARRKRNRRKRTRENRHVPAQREHAIAPLLLKQI
jgi:hypothetical protein